MEIKILKEKDHAKCELGEVRISTLTQHVDCESCGTLPPFEAVISNGYTWWCMNCAETVFDEDEILTRENIKYINSEIVKTEKKVILKRAKELKLL